MDIKQFEINNLQCSCGSTNYIKLFERKDKEHNFEILRCVNCKLVRTFPIPDYTIERYREYGIERYVKNKKLVVSFMKIIFNEVKKFKTKGKLLEVGCNLGYFLEIAKNNGFDIRGVELDDKAVNYANDLLGRGIVLRSTLEQANFPNNNFDIIVLSHVLEHLIDIPGFLKEIKRILNKQGIIAIASPNFDGLCVKIKKEKWPGLRPDEHVWQLSKNTIQKLLKKEGFVIIYSKTSGLYHNLASVLKDIRDGMHDKGSFKQIIYSMLNWLLGKLKMGDNVFIVAKNNIKI
ncbi:MAG: class I SAM-dependent methyltransferase [Patescibacteria group bacterium]